MSTSVAAEARILTPIHWSDGKVALLDQTRLPGEEVWLEMTDSKGVVEAIKGMRIRGAPAIGVAGAYAMALAAREAASASSVDFASKLEAAAENIRSARPTGANLAWAVLRMMSVASEATGGPIRVAEELLAEAVRIHEEDQQANRSIGRFGAQLIPPNSAVLTHCNTGALATGGHGTALGVIATAWSEGRLTHVYATETRPLLQGARLTAWELSRGCIDATVIPDSAAGQLMRNGTVQAVIVGADRIAANGDVANKIGTYSLAVLAKENGLPFYVAAPTSTIDLSLPSGDAIPIEHRPSREVTHLGDTRLVPEGVEVLNVAFDITPNDYVSAIITENGVAAGKPFDHQLSGLMEPPRG